MKTPFELIAEHERFKSRYVKDAEGHEHAADGKFTGAGGGESGEKKTPAAEGRKHENHGDAKVGDTVSFKTRSHHGIAGAGFSSKKITKKAKITRVNKNGTYNIDDGTPFGGTIASNDVTYIH